MSDVTRILNAIEQGDARATEDLLPLVYDELRLLAARKMSQELPGQTLQATALVHEAYLRLVGQPNERWESRGHFFKAAAEAIVLLSHAYERALEAGERLAALQSLINLAEAMRVKGDHSEAEEALRLARDLESEMDRPDRRWEIHGVLASIALSRGETERALAEARAAASLVHPHVVTLHTIGQDRERHFIELEFIDGQSLARLVESSGPLLATEATRLMMQISSALAAAHRMGMVHRDIKPSNVMRLHPVPGREYRPVKLMDFGIAKIDTAQLTAAGQVFGTPLYMAPEQASNQTVDARSDLFSLGAVLYTLLTGRDAFAANNVMATLQRVTNEDPVPPSTRNSASTGMPGRKPGTSSTTRARSAAYSCPSSASRGSGSLARP